MIQASKLAQGRVSPASNKAWHKATKGMSSEYMKHEQKLVAEKKKQSDEQKAKEKERQEELEEVRAMTMHGMIEDLQVGGKQKRLLFLTQKQAEKIASSATSLDTMLEKFDYGRPQLVINLLESGGFGEWTRQRPQDAWNKLNERWAPGVKEGHPPFLTPQDERAAEYRIDLFMSDILIPLAAETNAVIICCAIPTQCILSASFTRMFQAVKAKWQHKPPFTVLSTTNDMIALYSSNKIPKKPDKGDEAKLSDEEYRRQLKLENRYTGKHWKVRTLPLSNFTSGSQLSASLLPPSSSGRYDSLQGLERAARGDICLTGACHWNARPVRSRPQRHHLLDC